MAVKPVSFNAAMKPIDGSKNKHLLLGNGFSIALKPDIFSYGSLFENADFSKAPQIKSLFAKLGTQDFEVAIQHLQDAARVLEVYQPTLKELLQQLKTDASKIKDALVSAVAKRHPDRPYDITKEQYVAWHMHIIGLFIYEDDSGIRRETGFLREWQRGGAFRKVEDSGYEYED